MTYKVYDPDGYPFIFDKLSDLKDFLDLTDEEVGRVFLPGIHTVAFGVEVITF